MLFEHLLTYPMGTVPTFIIETPNSLSCSRYRQITINLPAKDSLGGNSKTMIIAAVSPASMSFGETLSTLKFAQSAKLVKNTAFVNEDTSGK